MGNKYLINELINELLHELINVIAINAPRHVLIHHLVFSRGSRLVILVIPVCGAKCQKTGTLSGSKASESALTTKMKKNDSPEVVVEVIASPLFRGDSRHVILVIPVIGAEALEPESVPGV